MGSLYRRGAVWWVKYYENGCPRRESTGTEKETEARRFLKEREGRVATGQPILPRADRISYEEVAQDLRQHYQSTGSRDLTESEVLTLELRQLNFEIGTLRLEPGTTKNDDGRVVYLTLELKALLAAQVERVRGLERETGHIIPYCFPHLRGRYRGKRIQDFKSAWKAACQKAGCPGMLRHDFRRTAVRNMVNLGVPERVAMKVTGHKTRSVFDRYHIVSPADLQEVARKLTGTFSGTVE